MADFDIKSLYGLIFDFYPLNQHVKSPICSTVWQLITCKFAFRLVEISPQCFVDYYSE